MKVFLDTEWADSNGQELVSLALVDISGQHRFYSEVNPLPKSPTDFVRTMVYPHLRHGYHARQKIELTRELRVFISEIESPEVIFDHFNDGRLLQNALDGFEIAADTFAKSPALSPLRLRMLSGKHLKDVRDAIETFYRTQPTFARRRHDSMVDAEVLRLAYLKIEENIK